ncbi:MAG: hypothetical protein IPG66_18425 [Hydrogenophilales bacterium]|nr:hypothetical protein [Hydrogenophilales bacterium]
MADAPERKNEDLSQKAWVTPIQPRKDFHFHLDFENLSEWELGALCYALQPSLDYRHKLGMGKPLGLGSIHIEPVGMFLVNRVKRYLSPSSRYTTVWFCRNGATDRMGLTIRSRSWLQTDRSIAIAGNVCKQVSGQLKPRHPPSH